MTINQALLTSKSAEWETPDTLFAKLNSFIPFTIDLAATPENTKCTRCYYLPDNDALTKDWGNEIAWLNPPYGREIVKFMEKCADTILANPKSIIVSLVPARVDTRWFQEYCFEHGYFICFIKGRLTFYNKVTPDCKDPAPFPSALVFFVGKDREVWGDTVTQLEDFWEYLNRLGYVVEKNR